jgi:hypothetical protein
MVLESLIQDDRTLTLDGCRATITKRTKAVEIPDEMYRTAEVQGAIKLGLVKIVGEPPVVKIPLSSAVIPEKKLKNVTTSRISLDCVRGLVMPGCYISIPVDKLDVYEVQNAVQSGWLVDEENPLPQRPIPTTKHIPLEELTAADVNDGPSELIDVNVKTQKKVLSRSSVEDDFYKPSQIQQSPKKKGLKGAQAPAPDQPSKIQIVQKQPISMAPKQQSKQTVSEELVDFLVTPAEQPAEATVTPKEKTVQEAEKPSDADDPLGFLLS